MFYDENNHRFINPSYIIRVKFRPIYSDCFELNVDLTMPHGINDITVVLVKERDVKKVEKVFVEKASEFLKNINCLVNLEDIKKDIKHGLSQVNSYKKHIN